MGEWNMNVQTISFLKQHAANLPLNEPMIVTQNGVACYAVTSYDEWVKWNEQVENLVREIDNSQLTLAKKLCNIG